LVKLNKGGNLFIDQQQLISQERPMLHAVSFIKGTALSVAIVNQLQEKVTPCLGGCLPQQSSCNLHAIYVTLS
jgi:hypothetical protein